MVERIVESNSTDIRDKKPSDYEVYFTTGVRLAEAFFTATVVEPAPPCKIGYSKDPLKRINSLRNGVPFNLMLVGVLQGFITQNEAEIAEKAAQEEAARLAPRVRGEWFDSEPNLIWEKVFEPRGGLLLNTRMDIDLNRAPLIPFRRGAWRDRNNSGISDAYHDYLDRRRETLGSQPMSRSSSTHKI